MKYIKKILNLITEFFMNKGIVKSGFLIGAIALFVLNFPVWAVLHLGAFLGANYEWLVNKLKGVIKF